MRAVVQTEPTQQVSSRPAPNRTPGPWHRPTRRPTRAQAYFRHYRRHSRGCPALAGPDRRCTCGAGYEAQVYDRATRLRIRRTFPTLAAAKSWRTDAEQGVRRGTLRAAAPVTVNDAADELVAGMRSGAVRTRSGDPYKPSAIRGYREALENHIRPELGAMRLGDVQRRHVQRLADRLVPTPSPPRPSATR
jgi:Phage integrase, N-terminal SAM-like domain